MSTDRMRRKGEDTETEEDWIVRPEDCVVPEPTVFPRRRLQEEKEGQKHSRERPQQQRKFPGNVSEDDEASGGSTIVSFDFPFPSGPLSKWLFPLLGEDEDDPLGPPPFLAPPTVEPPTPGDARQRPVVKKSSQFYQKSRVVHGQCTYWTMNSNINGETRHRAFRQCRGSPKEVLVSGKPLSHDAVWRPMTPEDKEF